MPTDTRRAKQLALTKSQYTLQDGVLFHVETNGTLRVIPPEGSREDLFQQAHGGVFGAHLREVKVYSELQRHYWWPGMRADIGRWSRGCLTCATHSTGRPVQPPLTPMWVGHLSELELTSFSSLPHGMGTSMQQYLWTT